MTLDPNVLPRRLKLLESIEKATLRLVVQAVSNFRGEVANIFAQESDLVADIGEDLTREALDKIGTSVISVRLFGKMDYKRARYLFLPEFSVRQALFVDSKAEKGSRVARVQTAQTSMTIKQVRGGRNVEEQGGLPTIIRTSEGDFLTTTIFVKYNYTEGTDNRKRLETVNVLCLPSGLLQARYNPTFEDTIWAAGPNSPKRGEAFRVR